MIKTYIKRVLKIVLLIIAVLLLLLIGIIINFSLHLEKHPSNKELGFNSPYYTYVSSRVSKKAKSNDKINILVVPNNSAGTSDDYKVHERMALLQCFVSHIVFKDLDTVILTPIFPRTNKDWNVYTHALDRDSMITDNRELKRTDLQLNGMIDETKNQLSLKGWKINDKVLMWGHSASGMFVNRYTFLHPERVSISVIYSPGGWAIAPLKDYKNELLRYPIGIHDVGQLTGSEVNLQELKKVKQLFILGSEDNNDSVPYSDSYDDEDRELINNTFGTYPMERWPISEQIYKEILPNVQFRVYEGMGHAPSLESLKDVIEYFKLELSSQ